MDHSLPYHWGSVLLKDFAFSEQFNVYNKIESKVQRFPIYSLPARTMQPAPLSIISHRSGTYYTQDESTMKHRHYSKCNIYISSLLVHII